MVKLKITFILILFCFLFFVLIHPALIFPETKPILARDLEEKAKELYNIEVDVTVFPNSKTKLQDLYIRPKAGEKYSSGEFIFSIAHIVADVTKTSFTYKLYTGMVIIEINDELWAISAKKCREIFKEETVEKQTNLLQENIKWLR